MAVGGRVGLVSWEVTLTPKGFNSLSTRGKATRKKIVLTVPGLRSMVQNEFLGLPLSAIEEYKTEPSHGTESRNPGCSVKKFTFMHTSQRVPFTMEKPIKITFK